MSASLVGSEMCIRDRREAAALALAACARCRRTPTLAQTLSRRAAAQLSCLLYTSDAADDM
eukprot:11099543-Alexandrium_andersonii.AAC.1